MLRKDLKIQLKICSQHIGGLSHSKITSDQDQLAYFFLNEASAQDALVKFNIGNTSVVTATFASKIFYKIVLTKSQFGENDFRLLLEFNELLTHNQYSQIESRLSEVSDLLLSDILLLSKSDLNLLTWIVGNPISSVYPLLNTLCDRAAPAILGSALLFQIDDHNAQWHPLSVLMNNHHENPTELHRVIIAKCLEQMTSASIDCMLQLKDESQEANFLFQEYTSYFFEKMISRAPQDFLNHTMVTVGIKDICSLISDNAMDSLITCVSSFALKIALMQRDNENKSGMVHAVEKLSQQSLRKMFEKLDNDWIDDLIMLLPTHALQMQARNAMSASHSQLSSARPINSTSVLSTAEKSLDELLIEAQASNQDNAELLQFIVDDDALKNLLLAIHRARDNHSILFATEEQSTLRDKPIAQWSIADCKIWAEKIKISEERLNRQYLPEMIAILTRGVELFAHYQPRIAQLVSLLVLLQPNGKGRLAQIATGEGKSLIVAMLAMIKIVQGEKVDIVTSSPILAERDANDHQAFYNIFNISVSHNWDKGIYRGGFKRCYDADVVYGSANCFQADLLRTEYELENTRGNRPYQTGIVDEVDSMMIDGYGNTTRLSMPKPSMEYLNLLFVSVWQQLVRIEQKLASSSVENRENVIKRLLKDYLIELISGDQTELYIPTHFKELCLYQIDNWIRSAMTARYGFREGFEYVISFKEDENRNVIAPIDHTNTGIVQNNTIWEDGLHQFLQIKHNLCLQAESLMTCFISNHGYFRRYGNHLYGMTGTLGGKQAQALLQFVYPVDLVFMPTCRPKRLDKMPGILSATERQWLSDITSSVSSQFSENKAVLLICESINVAKKIHAVLRETHRFPEHKLKLYTRNDNQENSVITETMDVGDILIATNLAARGTDIQITEALERNGGLFVCVTFLPENKRTEDQAFGRTARKGQPGTIQLIINKETTLRKLISLYPDYTASDTVEDYKRWRDVIEVQQLQRIKTFEFKKIALLDYLFAQYCDLRKTLRETRDNQFQLTEVEDLWSLWLKKWMDKIHQEKNLDEAQIVSDYAALADNITRLCERGELENPSQMLLSANRNFWQSSQTSIDEYTKAIAKDQVASFQAYYNCAFARIRNKSGNYRADAVQDLQMAKKILQEKVIPYLQAIVLLVTLNVEQRESNTDLTQPIQLKINFYQSQIQSIDQAISAIQQASDSSQLDIHVSNLSDKIKLLPSQQQSELYQSGLINLFGVYEIPKGSSNIFGALGVVFLGALQIVAGVLLSVVPGPNVFSKILIQEGISDIMYAVRSTLEGNFSWDHYLATKATSLAVNVITMGINMLNSNATASLTRSAAIDIGAVKSRVTSAIVRSGIRELANFGIGKLTSEVVDQFKSDIHHTVHSIVLRYFNSADAKFAINKLFSADLIHGNHDYVKRMRMLADEIIRSKQAVNLIAINILKSVVAKQHAGIASAIQLSDMAHSLDKIINLTEDFCQDFLNGIKILAHSLPTSDQDHPALQDELKNTLATYMTKHIMTALHGQVVSPAAVTLLDNHVNQLSDRALRICHEEANHSVAVARPVNRAVVVRNKTVQSQYSLTPDVVMRRFRNDMNSIADRMNSLLRNPSHTPYTTSARNALQPRPTQHRISTVARSNNFSQCQSNQSEGHLLVKNELKKIFHSRLRNQISDVAMVADVSNGTKNVKSYEVREAGRDHMINVLQRLIIANQYRNAIVSGVFNGITSGINHTVNMALHPLDTIIYPVTDFFRDAQIVGAGYPVNAANGRMINVNDPDAALLHYIIQQNPTIYHDAASRMQAKVDGVSESLRTFANATGPQRAEILTSMLVSCAMPGTTLKLGKIAAKMGTNAVSNYHHFRIFNPLKFEDIVRDFRSPPGSLPILSLTDIRLLKDVERLAAYVITEDKKLIISDRHFASHLYSPSEGFGKIRVGHAQLAEGKKVYAAGELIITDGKITSIDNNSGHFQPRGKMLEKLIERVFVKNGYSEVGVNTYVPKFVHAPPMQSVSPSPVSFSPANASLILFINSSNPSAASSQNHREEKNSSIARILRNTVTSHLRFFSDLIISPVEAAPLKETYPLCQRPYYEDAESAYSKVDGYGNFSSIGRLVGGKVQQNLDSGIFQNACALRASYALFNSTEVQSQVRCNIPRLKSNNGTETVTGGDGKQYIFRVHKLIDFLTHAWGPPDYDGRKNDNKEQSNLRKEGVVVSLLPEGSSFGFTGHAVISDDFYPSRNVLFWRLPSKNPEKSRQTEYIPANKVNSKQYSSIVETIIDDTRFDDVETTLSALRAAKNLQPSNLALENFSEHLDESRVCNGLRETIRIGGNALVVTAAVTAATRIAPVRRPIFRGIGTSVALQNLWSDVEAITAPAADLVDRACHATFFALRGEKAPHELEERHPTNGMMRQE